MWPLITSSRDKWKILYLLFHNTWSFQICQSINLKLEDPTHQVMWLFVHVVTWKIKNFYLHFNIYGCQIWPSRGLGWETPFPKSREHLTKWLRGHYLLNDFKVSVPIILKILFWLLLYNIIILINKFIDCSVMFSRW